ncbi:MAG: N-acetyltransferase family protein, partial [Gammaproteobacteria bacterium]
MTSIRSVSSADAAAIADIYNWYIANTFITFEEDAVSVQGMAERIARADGNSPWLVLEGSGGIEGYAYATEWKGRCAYRFSRETSIYLAHDRHGQGKGRHLYTALIEQLRQTPIHVLIAGIALPNDTSVTLHEKMGFRKIGQFEEVGSKFDRFIDVG